MSRLIINVFTVSAFLTVEALVTSILKEVSSEGPLQDHVRQPARAQRPGDTHNTELPGVLKVRHDGALLFDSLFVHFISIQR